MASFATALDSPQPYVPGQPVKATPIFASNVPVAQQQAAPVISRPDPSPGVPMLAGFELWVPPKPNIYEDGMPLVCSLLGVL